MKSILCAGILLFAFVVAAQAPFVVLAQAQDKPATNPVALNAEPHHHLLFENTYVRAWGFGIHGHDATLLHNHDLPYFGVAVGEADFVNAVAGKPEAHAKLADGQISYSKGGFAHLVRTETDTPFRNFTIELLKPQGAARNRCAKVLADGALDCPTGGATPLAAATTLAFETDEVAVQTGELSHAVAISGADAKQAHLVAALDKAELSVEVAGQPAKKLHGGEAMWLDAGTAANVVKSGDSSRFLLLTFKDSAKP